MSKNLSTLLAELKGIQDAYRGKAMPTDVAEQFSALAAEAKAMQDAEDAAAARDAAIASLEARSATSREPVSRTQPAAEAVKSGAQHVGYVTLGEYVAASAAIKGWNAAGQPGSSPASITLSSDQHVKRRHDGAVLIPVTEQQANELKAAPTLGANVIVADRDPDVVRSNERLPLRLRDVLNVGRTASNAITFTRITTDINAAAPTAAGSAKPEGSMVIDAVTVPVRTIPVHIPVHNSQLEDLPQLADLINDSLLFDVERKKERLAIYGSGAGEQWTGLVTDAGVTAMRSVGGDTLIDIIRRGITDVRRAGGEPSTVLASALDWEQIVLTKGTDDRYVWVVVTEGATQRMWGLTVVETEAMVATAGSATEQRNIIVGDFLRGATLWERADTAITVGLIDQQFTRNMRTILAESRAAFGIKRPAFFKKHQTQVAVP